MNGKATILNEANSVSSRLNKSRSILRKGEKLNEESIHTAGVG